MVLRKPIQQLFLIYKEGYNMIGLGVSIVVMCFGLGVLYYTFPDVGIAWYKLQGGRSKAAQQNRKRVYKGLVRMIEAGIPHPLLHRLNHMVRMAGRPYGLEAPDWVLVELGVILVTWPPLMLRGSRFSGLLLSIAFMALPWLLLRSKAKQRRLDAQTQIRAMKRMFRMKLLDGAHIPDALQSVGDAAIGEFGDTFRKHLTRLDQSMKIAMQGLRDEYGIPELDVFALALELGEEKTSQELLKELNRQIDDEYKHIQNYLEARMSRLKMAQGGAIFLLVLVVVGVMMTFAVAGTLHMIGKGGLLG
ncbi:hypothetical protein GI364_04320 [Alicyclobacillus sp. SO9]|nr:hypothetical protein GI364_04320 [Alicyclobacillus sp. SO9]